MNAALPQATAAPVGASVSVASASRANNTSPAADAFAALLAALDDTAMPALVDAAALAPAAATAPEPAAEAAEVPAGDAPTPQLPALLLASVLAPVPPLPPPIAAPSAQDAPPPSPVALAAAPAHTTEHSAPAAATPAHEHRQAGLAVPIEVAKPEPAAPASSFERTLAALGGDAAAPPPPASDPLAATAPMLAAPPTAPAPPLPLHDAAPRPALHQAALASHPLDAAFGGELATEVRWMVERGVQRAELHLHPAELGPIHVQLTVSAGSADISFAAAHGSTREGLAQALPVLREMLAGQGLQLGQAGVSAGGGGQPFAQPQSQPQSQPQHQARTAAGEPRTAPGALPLGPTQRLPARRNAGLGMLDLYA